MFGVVDILDAEKRLHANHLLRKHDSPEQLYWSFVACQ